MVVYMGNFRTTACSLGMSNVIMLFSKYMLLFVYCSSVDGFYIND